MAKIRASLLLLVCIWIAPVSFAETSPKGSVIPSLSTLGKETPLQPELLVEGHAGPIKVEVRRDLNNPEKYFYRPLFYLDIEKFNAELAVCEGAEKRFEPQDFVLDFVFPNLSVPLAQAIEIASEDDRKIRATDVLGVANLGLEIRFKDIFEEGLIYQDISEDLLPAGPLRTLISEAVNGRTCGDWYLLKKFLERGVERFEANVFVWSSENNVPKTIDIKFNLDVLDKIENQIFGSADYSIGFDENRGGSEQKEGSSSFSQTQRDMRTGASYSAGASIPIGSFSLGGEVSRTGSGSERDNSTSKSKSDIYNSITNRLTQSVSGGRILSRDYLTSFGLDSRSGFTFESVNFSPSEAADLIEVCREARERALDYIPVRLELNDQNKAVLTIREFQEQIGMVDLEANDIERLKAAGGLDLDITVLDRTTLRNTMRCDFEISDQQSRPTGKWKLTYEPTEVANAHNEKQKAAQVDATLEELAKGKFGELMDRIELLESLDNGPSDELKMKMEIAVSQLAKLEIVLDGAIDEIGRNQRANQNLINRLQSLYSESQRLYSVSQTDQPVAQTTASLAECVLDLTKGKTLIFVEEIFEQACNLKPSSFVTRINTCSSSIRLQSFEQFQVKRAGATFRIVGICFGHDFVSFHTMGGYQLLHSIRR